MRRFGNSPRRDQHYTARPGAYGVILSGSKLLLTFEDATEPEIQLPGGGIDPGEGPVQALHREVFEETGWSIRVLHRLGVYQRYTYMPDYDLWARKICHIYLCQTGLRHSAPLEAHHTAMLVDRSEAPHLLTNSGDGHFTARALARDPGNRQ